jgi:hypothetical protein
MTFAFSAGNGRLIENSGRIRRNSLLVLGFTWDADPGAVTPPTGWVEEDKRVFQADATRFCGMYTKITDNNEPVDRFYSFSWANSVLARASALVIEHVDTTNPFRTGYSPSDAVTQSGGNGTSVSSASHPYNDGELGLGFMFVSSTLDVNFFNTHDFGDANRFTTDGDHDINAFLTDGAIEDISLAYPGSKLVNTNGAPDSHIFYRHGQAKSTTSIPGLNGTFLQAAAWQQYHCILNPGAPTVEEANGGVAWTGGDNNIVVNGLDFL